ncbi:DoxX family protein [Cryptosporangium minutisporangium]|uniref:Membrane protein n=1 Tax=Cryptosporangium minutisporangium TaxID=113569 RepID=A0ABP6SXW7_9ACTN
MATRWKKAAPPLLAGLLGTMGVLHFVAPKPFARIIPKGLPAPDALVAISGAAELACAALVAVPRTRRVGALASAALFVGVYPANVQMALDARRSSDSRYKAIAYGRLPFQAPLIAWALGVAKNAR